ncbi:MAG: class I tRNA ligase family protein [Paracoccaceae bacterium]
MAQRRRRAPGPRHQRTSIRHPGEDGRRRLAGHGGQGLHNWFDAPIEHLRHRRTGGGQRPGDAAWERWWRWHGRQATSPGKRVHGKDNVPFHTALLPGDPDGREFRRQRASWLSTSSPSTNYLVQGGQLASQGGVFAGPGPRHPARRHGAGGCSAMRRKTSDREFT